MAEYPNPYDRLLNAISLRLSRSMQSKLVAQIEFATVTEVQEKTCTVQMLTDKQGVVTEGIGLQVLANSTVKPLLGSKCLVAHIMNDDSEGFIIWAEKIEKFDINGNQHGGLIIESALVQELQKMNTLLSTIQQAFFAWQPAPGDGGAALKAASQAFVNMQLPTFQAITNTSVNHG